jgi:hypothetical protein
MLKARSFTRGERLKPSMDHFLSFVGVPPIVATCHRLHEAWTGPDGEAMYFVTVDGAWDINWV